MGVWWLLETGAAASGSGSAEASGLKGGKRKEGGGCSSAERVSRRLRRLAKSSLCVRAFRGAPLPGLPLAMGSTLILDGNVYRLSRIPPQQHEG